MSKKTENDLAGEWLKDLPLRSEDGGFQPEELIACEKCGRKNAPNRAKCLYCGTKLTSNEPLKRIVKTASRALEIWEKGFNLVFLKAEKDLTEENLSFISEILQIEKEAVEKLFAARKKMPLKRFETFREAEAARAKLNELEIESFVLSDEELAFEKMPQRLRAIEFDDDELILILFNNDEIVRISKASLSLIVSGAIFQKKIEATEKRGKKGENKILQASETAFDEIVLDIYSRDDSQGFRIFGKGFDFSCLETEKGILAVENMKKLIKKLQDFAADAKLVDDYLEARENLAAIWAIDQRTDSLGLTRESFGRFNLGNVTTTNNLVQFTKYSRLQWHLYEGKREIAE